MADLVVIIGVVAFLVVCMAYVVGCDRILGPETTSESGPDDAERMSMPDVPGSA